MSEDEIQPMEPKGPSMGLQLGRWMFCAIAGLVAQKYAGAAFDHFKNLMEKDG